ncbi:unnamed protein product [Penicillium roqueforti FM164]|uniref:Genomic scaffold, ProqFM164S02 n=1 Tax=Penicillium roqueforti (strain FM164) TaxID=1365484 RepID=W6Q379_PENRF|nr:unnamed protein product [Penicillium roqueforti FM164]
MRLSRNDREILKEKISSGGQKCQGCCRVKCSRKRGV